MPHAVTACEERRGRLLCLVDRRTNSSATRMSPQYVPGSVTVNHLDRRHFLSLMGLSAVAVAAGGSLVACSKDAGSAGTATNTDAMSALLPKYMPMDLVKPDIVGTSPVANGFLKYPANLVDAITAKPGTSGQKATAMTPWWGPTPPGLGQNA